MTSRRQFLFGSLAVAAAPAALGTVATAPAYAAPARPRQARQARQAGVKVMPLGDSITDGYNVPGGYRVDLWQKFLSGGYAVDFVGSSRNGPSSLGDQDHEGHSGWTIGQIDENITGWLGTYSPHTILLHIGTNDVYGDDPAGAPARLTTLVDRITGLSPDAELFVATIIPLGWDDANLTALNSAIPGIVQNAASAGKKVHLVDMFSALNAGDLADGVHPNAGGYSKMATVWYDALLTVPGSIGNARASR
jgi:lysophospholipase L1-like esterase